jgi:hypothetical protein
MPDDLRDPFQAALSRLAAEFDFESAFGLGPAWARTMREAAFRMQSRFILETKRRLDERLRALGLESFDIDVLEVLRVNGPTTRHQLAARVGAQVVLRLDVLQRHNAVRYYRSGPHLYVDISYVGEALLRTAINERDAALEEAYAGFSDGDLCVLTAVLIKPA